MKNPMIENNINTELFEAIDEHDVNGGLRLDPGARIPRSADCGCKVSVRGVCIKQTFNCPIDTIGRCGITPIIDGPIRKL